MDSDATELNQAAELLDAMARRLADAAGEVRLAAKGGEEDENPGCGSAVVAPEPKPKYVDWTDKMRFEREAKPELAELFRQVEGPNPPRAPRREG
jgi:hypothetical protein